MLHRLDGGDDDKNSDNEWQLNSDRGGHQSNRRKYNSPLVYVAVEENVNNNNDDNVDNKRKQRVDPEGGADDSNDNDNEDSPWGFQQKMCGFLDGRMKNSTAIMMAPVASLT